MNAVLREVPGVVAASPVVPMQDRLPVVGGQEHDIQVLGVYPDYLRVRNLVILSGRFFDQQDLAARNKVGVITDALAEQLYGPKLVAHRKSDQIERSAVHDNWHVQGTREHVWAI